MKQVLSNDYEVLRGHAGEYRPWCDSPHHSGPPCPEMQRMQLRSPAADLPVYRRRDAFMESIGRGEMHL